MLVVRILTELLLTYLLLTKYLTISSLIQMIFSSCTQDYGDLEFQSTSVCTDIQNEYGAPIHAIPIPGGESYEAVLKRNSKFFSVSLFVKTFSQYIGDVVLIYLHAVSLSNPIFMCIVNFRDCVNLSMQLVFRKTFLW